jgi:ABC-2 type transport system ATP-binding protein
MPAIAVRELSKTYRVRVPVDRPSPAVFLKPPMRDIKAVDRVSFEVEAGESLAFLGPNGAGKSTTIKMLAGILYPSSGSIDVLGLNPQRDRRRLGFLIGSVFGQKSQLWYHLPARDSFRLLGAIYEIEAAELKKRTGELVERFGLAEFFDQSVRKLSLGQRIRCELAASLLHKPKLLFLDEPTIGLDVVVKQEIRALLTEWNKQEKVTLFLTSHDVGDVEKLCRRAVLIHHGRLVLDESLKTLKRQAAERKIIGVRYDGPLEIVVPGVEPAKRTADSAKFIVDGSGDWQALIRRLVDLGPVADLTVEDEPLENLIADLYRRKAPETVTLEAADAPVAG